MQAISPHETTASAASRPAEPASSAEPLPSAEASSSPQGREQHIPLGKSELVARILADAQSACGVSSATQRRQIGELCRLLSAVLHHEYHARLEDLKAAYAPFDPDGDLKAGRPRSDRAPSSQRDAACDALFDRVVSLFERANYRRLRREDIDAALASMSEVGVRLDVDLAAFERLELFVRGDGEESRQRRRLRNFYRAREVNVPTYARLVVAFHPREHKRIGEHARPEHVYLKMFKNIPKMDLDMLLPGTRVRMSLFEQGRILLPAVSGVGLAVYKVLQGALVLAFAGVYGLLAFLGVVGGTLGYGVRSFVGYLRTKDKHQLYLTRSLYFQNLDNNVGVLFRVLDEAEEQDFREALLAYYLLWREGDTNGATIDELDRLAEAWILKATGEQVDFEIDDALAKLERWKLVEAVGVGCWRARPPESALSRLDRLWDEAYRTPEL